MAKPNVKEQIVTASLGLLHSKGFNATSVQDITDAAGVPKGSFYNHFASKEALGMEVLQRYSARSADIAAMLRDPALPPLERIRQYVDRMIEANAAYDFNCGCMLGNFSAELASQVPGMRAVLQASFAQWGAVLAAAIAEGQADGSIANPQPADELAAFIIDAWQGAVLRSKAEHSVEPLQRFSRMVLRRILQ